MPDPSLSFPEKFLPHVPSDTCTLCLWLAALLLLFDLEQQCAVDVWQNASESNCGADEGVQLFVTANGEL